MTTTDDMDPRACVELWRAVIVRAMKDAVGVKIGNGGPSRANLEKLRARSWLLSGSDDMREVCMLADADPDRVVAWARRENAAGWPDLTGLLTRNCPSAQVSLRERVSEVGPGVEKISASGGGAAVPDTVPEPGEQPRRRGKVV